VRSGEKCPKKKHSNERNIELREKSHTSRSPVLGSSQRTPDRPHGVGPWPVVGGVSGLIWVCVVVGLIIHGTGAGVGLERLADSEPDASRRQRIDPLRVTRGLMLPADDPAGEALIWSALGSAPRNNLFLAGAIRAERAGRPREACLWLALDAKSRGWDDRMRLWAKQGGWDPDPIERARPTDPDWFERDPLGRHLKDLLGGPEGGGE
jgi:hypothetical protein